MTEGLVALMREGLLLALLLAAVTADDVQRVAGQYLTRANRTVAVLVKKPAERKIAAGRMGEVAP